MCGIIGIASTQPIEETEWLHKASISIAHRGPDDSGIYICPSKKALFAHRRLSIQDLSPSGHQPMATEDGSEIIVFNGEIYNFLELRDNLEAKGYSFASRSDTEVLLVAYRHWGREFIKYIQGMFAFAILNRKEETVFLARDRAGEKPLFYRLTNREIRFASELKALLADVSLPRTVNKVALDCYLAFGYVPGDACILTDYAKLPPAHAMEFNMKTSQVDIWEYWSPPEYEAEAGTSTQELTQQLENLLEQSVKRQLVADVPVGLLLSGGVDSSLITAMASRAGGRPRTFTVGFNRFSQYDEKDHALLVANYFGTNHTVLEADEVSPDILHLLSIQYDEPIVDSSMIPTYLVSKLLRQNCKVALGGDGGDELFGGYYSASRMAQLQNYTGKIPLAPRRWLARSIKGLLPFGSRGRNFLTHLSFDASRDVPPFSPQFEWQFRRRIFKDQAQQDVASQIRRERTPFTTDAVQRVTRFDFRNYLPEDILVKVDRASMLNSLEIRSPFLDTPILDFAFRRVPTDLKASPTDRKILLKHLAKKVLPPNFDLKRKQGFGIPIDEWLRKGPWRNFFESVLFDSGSLVNTNIARTLFAALDKGRSVKEQLFALTLFELWRRHYNVQFA
jgi:asparagine synthase (glutamine-hydrolysing)